ncbi:hypothetical protein LGT39_06010 [Demequina sp. TTPB684]|uniref:hypothetical protein n=1 Tax=unclassified Demequina TaxID=2620311 RepID=UPI001CF27CDB|nr:MULTISPECIES: hypothetical protein [unclassified Demequina]MCB2412402.1 hypothetical protein [Demequina sp. TTPB684]UPU89514.1 hypothetical protein LGT36_006185 [Demequina sp. TMPB413]
MNEGERKRLGGLRATLLVIGGVIASVIATSMMVMPTIRGPWDEGPPEMTGSEQRHFWTAAVVLWGIQLGLLAVAWKFRSAPVGVIGSFALLAAIVMTSVLISPFHESAAPADREAPEQHRPVCYSGSGDCLGG